MVKQVVEAFDSYVHQMYLFLKSFINGLTGTETLKNAPKVEEVSKFQDFVGDLPLVGYNEQRVIYWFY